MKRTKSLALSALIVCAMFLCVACGNIPETTITLGKYNEANQTFTANTSADNYSLTINGTTLTLKGTIPYSSSVLGIDAGNIVAIKFMPNTSIQADSSTSIKTTNRQGGAENNWNTYDQSALETDGSLIWVTSVNKTNNVQIKIKWNKNYDEVTYTLVVDNSATLASAT